MGTLVPAARESTANLAPLSGLPSEQGPRLVVLAPPCSPCLWQEEYRSVMKSCVLAMPSHSGLGHRWTFGRTAHACRRALEAFTSTVCLTPGQWTGLPGLLAPGPCGVPQGTGSLRGVVELAAPPLPLSRPHPPHRTLQAGPTCPFILLLPENHIQALSGLKSSEHHMWSLWGVLGRSGPGGVTMDGSQLSPPVASSACEEAVVVSPFYH